MIATLLATAACSSDESPSVPSDGSSSTVEAPATTGPDDSVAETSTPAALPSDSVPSETDAAPVESDPPPFVINGPATVDDEDQSDGGSVPASGTDASDLVDAVDE